MKSHGTKIKVKSPSAHVFIHLTLSHRFIQIGTSVSNVNRTDSSTVSASASSAKLRGSQLDTPCPTATIFDLCTTANDSSLHKKRKTRSSKENASSSSSAGAGAGAGDTGGGRDKEKDRADRVAAALQAAEKAASRSQPKRCSSPEHSVCPCPSPLVLTHYLLFIYQVSLYPSALTVFLSRSTPAPAPLGPQVEIVNGQIVLRESSLVRLLLPPCLSGCAPDSTHLSLSLADGARARPCDPRGLRGGGGGSARDGSLLVFHPAAPLVYLGNTRDQAVL